MCTVAVIIIPHWHCQFEGIRCISGSVKFKRVLQFVGFLQLMRGRWFGKRSEADIVSVVAMECAKLGYVCLADDFVCRAT